MESRCNTIRKVIPLGYQQKKIQISYSLYPEIFANLKTLKNIGITLLGRVEEKNYLKCDKLSTCLLFAEGTPYLNPSIVLKDLSSDDGFFLTKVMHFGLNNLGWFIILLKLYFK